MDGYHWQDSTQYMTSLNSFFVILPSPFSSYMATTYTASSLACPVDTIMSSTSDGGGCLLGGGGCLLGGGGCLLGGGGCLLGS